MTKSSMFKATDVKHTIIFICYLLGTHQFNLYSVIHLCNIIQYSLQFLFLYLWTNHSFSLKIAIDIEKHIISFSFQFDLNCCINISIENCENARDSFVECQSDFSSCSSNPKHSSTQTKIQTNKASQAKNPNNLLPIPKFCKFKHFRFVWECVLVNRLARINWSHLTWKLISPDGINCHLWPNKRHNKAPLCHLHPAGAILQLIQWFTSWSKTHRGEKLCSASILPNSRP